MKLVFTGAKIPEDLKVDAVRFLATYNALHATKHDFYSLNYSDLVRLALKDFLENRHPSKIFLPGGETT